MGASTFYSTANGDSARQAFNRACEDAAYEYGHGGYTGTIAEKDSFVMCNDTVFNTYDEAYDFASDLVDKDDSRISDKWGPAGCVKFKSGDKVSYLFFGWASC